MAATAANLTPNALMELRGDAIGAILELRCAGLQWSFADTSSGSLDCNGASPASRCFASPSGVAMELAGGCLLGAMLDVALDITRRLLLLC